MSDAPAFPRPGLEGRALTAGEYMACSSEKLELLEGHLYMEEELLMFVLTGVGLRRAVELVGREAWLAAADSDAG